MGKPDALSQRANHGTGSNDNSNIVLLPSKLFAICAVEGLEFIRPKRDILRDIHKGSKRLDQAGDKEPVVKAVHNLRKLSSCSLHSAEWLEHDSLLYYHGHIYIPRPLSFDNTLSHFVMTLRSPDTPDTSKPSNLFLETTGGPTCHAMLASTSVWKSSPVWFFDPKGHGPGL